MAAAKKKPKIKASEIEVGKRTLEGVLFDLAEHLRANDARCAERSARAEELSARAEERSVRAEELAMTALQTIAAVSQDLRAITQELRVSNSRTESRLDALEKARA